MGLNLQFVSQTGAAHVEAEPKGSSQELKLRK